MPAPSTGNGQTPGQAQGAGPPGMTEADWKIAVESVTNVCKGAGKVPGGFEELIKANGKNVADWRAILREFVEQTVPSDYSWASPNRRHIANGVYLPGVTQENLGHVAIAIDTSGSIDSGLLASFCTELNSIVQEAKPDRVSVIYCDSRVHRTDEFGQDEAIEMKATGRGGTAFRPVFESVSKWDSPPVCLIYFTDLDSSDVPSEPEYPVLWATSECVTGNGPFGRTVRISEGK
jgi:predicted metal-dependent peptidase